MKTYVLIVENAITKSKSAMLVNTSELGEALKIYKEKINKQSFVGDKGCIIPRISNAEICPVINEKIDFEN